MQVLESCMCSKVPAYVTHIYAYIIEVQYQKHYIVFLFMQGWIVPLAVESAEAFVLICMRT